MKLVFIIAVLYCRTLAAQTVPSLGQYAISVINEPKTYTTAYRDAMESGKPLLVHLGTTWCGPCHEMQARLDRMRVEYVHIDCEADPKLAGQLLVGTSIPQCVIYFRVKNVWKHKNLIGPKSEREIREFIEVGK
jgi:thiol-disulfide isomerase/thioredoxin